MAKKIVKRKSEAVGESEGKKKLKTEEKPAEGYTAGGLSSLFGKSDDGAVVETVVTQGSSKIEKPKRRKFVPKEKGKESEENDENVKEEGETKEGEKKDRSQQRLNRVKGKQNARAIAAENAKTIFVGNMPLTATEKLVRKTFAEYGKIDSVRMRGVIPTNEKTSKRVAHLTGKFNKNQTSLMFYIKFENEESVEKALKYNGTDLEGHIIRVDKCGVKKEFSKEFAVFVGNLSFDTKEDDLLKFFEKSIGPVEAVRIVRDKATGTGKGFAFVNFKEDSSASLAITMETIKMGERDLRITKVMKKGQLNKIDAAKKKTGGNNKQRQEIKGKMENFKFSNKKQRTDEQNERRALKKTAVKAIKRKAVAKKGRLMQ